MPAATPRKLFSQGRGDRQDIESALKITTAAAIATSAHGSERSNVECDDADEQSDDNGHRLAFPSDQCEIAARWESCANFVSFRASWPAGLLHALTTANGTEQECSHVRPGGESCGYSGRTLNVGQPTRLTHAELSLGGHPRGFSRPARPWRRRRDGRYKPSNWRTYGEPLRSRKRWPPECTNRTRWQRL
jgi:hypothetical protein